MEELLHKERRSQREGWKTRSSTGLPPPQFGQTPGSFFIIAHLLLAADNQRVLEPEPWSDWSDWSDWNCFHVQTQFAHIRVYNYFMMRGSLRLMKVSYFEDRKCGVRSENSDVHSEKCCLS